MKPYTLQSIEAGKRKVDYNELEKLCDYYNITVEEVIRNKESLPTDKIFISSFNSLPDDDKRDVLDFIAYKQYKK